MTLELLTGQHLDVQPPQAGWVVQDYGRMNLAPGQAGVARELPTDVGSANYLHSAPGWALRLSGRLRIVGEVERRRCFPAGLDARVDVDIARRKRLLPATVERAHEGCLVLQDVS